MINKEDYRNMDSIMNWGKYAEALEQEVARLEKEVQHRDVALKCYEKLFEHATNEINKLKKLGFETRIEKYNEEVDINGDGVISFDEFSIVMKKMLKK